MLKCYVYLQAMAKLGIRGLYTVFHKGGSLFVSFIIHSNDDQFTQKITSCNLKNTNTNKY